MRQSTGGGVNNNKFVRVYFDRDMTGYEDSTIVIAEDMVLGPTLASGSDGNGSYLEQGYPDLPDNMLPLKRSGQVTLKDNEGNQLSETNAFLGPIPLLLRKC